MAVTQPEGQDIPHLHRLGGIGHVQNTVIRGAADDSDAGHGGPERLHVAYVGPAQRQNGTESEATILIDRLSAEGVGPQLPLGIGGLLLHLHHLCLQTEHVVPEVVCIVDAPGIGNILRRQNIFSDP